MTTVSLSSSSIAKMMSLRPRNPPVVAAEPKDQENLVKLAGKHPQLTRVSGTVTHRAALGDIQNRLGGQNLPAGKKKSLDLEKKPLKAVGKVRKNI